MPWKQRARCFIDWFDSRGGAEAGEVQAAISQVRLFIERHGDSRFELVGTQDRNVNNRAGWRKGDGAEREWLIPPRFGSRKLPLAMIRSSWHVYLLIEGCLDAAMMATLAWKESKAGHRGSMR